jgi:hypothetical protein
MAKGLRAPPRGSGDQLLDEDATPASSRSAATLKCCSVGTATLASRPPDQVAMVHERLGVVVGGDWAARSRSVSTTPARPEPA